MPIFLEKYKFISENKVHVSSYVRACLHGGGATQIGDVIRLAVVRNPPLPTTDKASDYESGDSRFESWRGRCYFE